MPAPIKLNADDGLIAVEVNGDDGSTPIVVRLDTFEANNTYAALCDQHTDPIERVNAWCDWLEGKGFPRLTHGNALSLAAHIMKQVELQKKTLGFTSPGAGSPASTGSTASDVTSPPDQPAT